ncbi:prenyltransferase/squalene oxidase repeat-containing protein [Phytohabitans suffuscus]|nr:prenyltransferase/squalene oxidase repeat-containing protein [Phytohabitans suffuscus]
MDGAIGFVVAHGDSVDRARLSFLRTGAGPTEDILTTAEIGQSPDGGWPARWGAEVASIDATCFRLAELDDLGALDRQAARRALAWLASRQHDGMWEEDDSLAAEAPPWAKPGDPEARLYVTTNAAFWLTVSDLDAGWGGGRYGALLRPAAQAIAAHIGADGSWKSFLVSAWLSAAVLHRQDMFYESARIQIMLGDRLSQMSPADVASMASALRRVGVAVDEWLLTAARRRLAETQRSDGGWTSDDGAAFDVHTTLAAIRATR